MASNRGSSTRIKTFAIFVALSRLLRTRVSRPLNLMGFAVPVSYNTVTLGPFSPLVSGRLNHCRSRTGSDASTLKASVPASCARRDCGETSCPRSTNSLIITALKGAAISVRSTSSLAFASRLLAASTAILAARSCGSRKASDFVREIAFVSSFSISPLFAPSCMLPIPIMRHSSAATSDRDNST